MSVPDWWMGHKSVDNVLEGVNVRVGRTLLGSINLDIKKCNSLLDLLESIPGT